MAKVVKGYARVKRTRHREKRQESHFGDFLYRFFAIVSALALAISYLSEYVDPVWFRIPMYFGLYFLPLAALNLLMLVIGLFRWKRSFLIPLVALLPALILADRFVKIGNDQTSLNGEHIKVLTYNLGKYQAAGKDMSWKEIVNGIKSFIQAEDADIVCLQEFSVKDTAMIGSCLPSYPYVAHHFFKGSNYFGNVTLSRYPIAETEHITFSKSTNLALASDIKIGDRMVKIYNCHLESYSISFTSLIKHLRKKGAFQEEFNLVHEKVRTANIKRSEQVRTVLESEESSCCPTIVCGDFNDMPVSFTYHKLTSSKKDSFIEAGQGFSGTYSTLWPLLRIDYILIPGEYSAENHTIRRVPFSDHYPVSTNIYFEQ